MTDSTAASAPAPSSVPLTSTKLGVGPYAYSELTILPDWYLAHLLADATEPKWSALNPEQQAAVQAEAKRRHPDDDVGLPVAAPPAASASPLTVATATAPASDSVSSPSASTPHTRESDEAILSGTVAEVTDHLSKVSNTIALDALKTVEEAGKNRAGVLTAIEKRRAEIEAASVAAAAPAVSPAVPESPK